MIPGLCSQPVSPDFYRVPVTSNLFQLSLVVQVFSGTVHYIDAWCIQYPLVFATDICCVQSSEKVRVSSRPFYAVNV